MVTHASQRPLAWVVSESMFGNTQRIANAIADGLREAHDVVVHEVSEAPDVVPDDVVLLVIGGPTHGFSLSTAQSREQAKKQAGGDVISARRGLREWLGVVELQGRPASVVSVRDASGPVGGGPRRTTSGVRGGADRGSKVATGSDGRGDRRR